MRTQIYNRIRDRMLATAGIAGVGAVSRLPLLGQNVGSHFVIEGQETKEHPPEVEFRAATPTYFITMKIRLLAGRLFEDRDFATRLELIIDLATAQRFFPTTDPIGKRVRFLADSAGSWHTIIGVVGNTRHFGLEVAPRPTLYRHVVTNPLVSPVLVIRTKTDPSPMMQTLTGIVREAHADMPAYNVFSMEQLVERSTAQRRFLMWLTTAFACAGLLLAAIGVYGAISQSVAQRTKELGVRMALGATKTNVLMLVVGEGLQIAAAGAAISVGLGWIAARLGRSLLFEVQPHDPAVYAGALLAILACAMLACYCGVGSSGIFAG